MNRELKNRLRRLERRMQVGAELKLFDDRQCFTTLKGSAAEFFRLVEHGLLDRAPNGERWALAEMRLNDLRRATRIEGPSAQLFGLLRALALGPVDSQPTNPKEKANG